MNKALIGLVLIVLMVTIYLIVSENERSTVTINNREFRVELAKTNEAQTKGLSGRAKLNRNRGMLFIFQKEDIYSFWMKDTLIPLDIIWINDSKIVEMTTLQPQTADNIPQYAPIKKASYVLEINEGLAQEYGFQIGDEVKISAN